MQLYLENTGLNKDVKGYAGPIDIGMAVGADGKSARSATCARGDHQLPAGHRAGRLLRAVPGIPLDGKSYEVDLVSGASLTSEGIASSVSKLVSIARESPLEVYLDTQAEGFDVKAVLPDTWIISAALIAALFLVVLSRKVRQSTR